MTRSSVYLHIAKLDTTASFKQILNPWSGMDSQSQRVDPEHLKALDQNRESLAVFVRPHLTTSVITIVATHCILKSEAEMKLRMISYVEDCSVRRSSCCSSLDTGGRF